MHWCRHLPTLGARQVVDLVRELNERARNLVQIRDLSSALSESCLDVTKELG